MHGGLISLFCCAALLCAAQQPQASDEQVAARFQEARDAFHAGRLDAAAAAYKDVLRWRPGLLEARMNLGLVHFSAGAYQSAVTEMTSVIQAQPSLAPAHVILGLSWMKLASPGKAAAALRRGVRLNPSDAEARRALALCDQATGNYGEAVEQFRALFALEPDPETAWFQLGHSYLELSRQLTDELLSRYPSSVWLQRLKGDLLCDRSLWTAAEQEYRTALALDPAQPGLRAALIAAQKHADPAVESIPRGCTTGDDQACAASLRASRPPTADGYLRLGRTCFGRLLSAFPKSARTHQLRAETNRVRGANDEATREYRAAIRLRPDDAGLHAALGELYLLVHSPAEARVELETAARLDPDARTLHLLGRAYLGQDEFAQAVPYLERAVHSGPELLEAHADLGRAYLRTGKPDLAAPELEKALPLDRSGDLHYLLFQCYSALGKSESASAALARSRALRKAAFAGDRARFPGAITPP